MSVPIRSIECHPPRQVGAARADRQHVRRAAVLGLVHREAALVHEHAFPADGQQQLPFPCRGSPSAVNTLCVSCSSLSTHWPNTRPVPDT